ncbi:MAG: AbrB/MazE/SpoVT family DNA-binding domain-containing protein [Thermoanaerobaculia bacterium]|nr:AbrB/MazE/SpoVT family DNA-binding domain-containing protein [Thermoanaerobaculia bacterium]
MILTLQARNTLTIPQELRKALRLKPGEPLDARIERGSLVLTPVAVVPRTLALSGSGEALEAEADVDVREGRISTYDSAAALLEDLER